MERTERNGDINEKRAHLYTAVAHDHGSILLSNGGGIEPLNSLLANNVSDKGRTNGGRSKKCPHQRG
ncbi:MAG: hypothetical protein PWQ88_1169 [Candidatus Methanomethylophilaceae archaeon]|nr:hypothetical protein [Candidatus Methanomethylophilaceae archaeon]